MSIAVPSVARPRTVSTKLRGLAADRCIQILTAVVVFTLLLRFSQIHQSIFGDEVFTYADIHGRSFRAVLTNVNTGAENSPPLFFLLAYATAKLGDPTVWIRLPSIVLGAATLVFVFLIGQETIGRRAGVLAAVLLAVSPFTLYYGVEARPYSTMAFFVSVSTWALLRALDTDRRVYWATFTLATACATYSHYTSIFVLGVQAIWALWLRRDRIKAPLIACVVAALLYVPWLPNLRGKGLSVIGQLEPLTPVHVLHDLARPIAGYPYAAITAIPTIPGLVVVIACALFGAACLLRPRLQARGGTASAEPYRFWLLAALALATPVGLLLYSMLFTDLWLARGLYASIPAGALVLAGLLLAIPRRFNIAAIVLVLAVLVVGLVRAASPSWRRPPTRSVASYIDRMTSAADQLSLAAPFASGSILAEFHHRHHVVSHYALFQSTRPGDDAVLVLADALAHDLHSSVEPAAPAGFTIVAHRHFDSAILPIDVTIYRNVGHT